MKSIISGLWVCWFLLICSFQVSLRGQGISISGPAAGASFLAPATVTVAGEVEIAEGESFLVRVLKRPLPYYNARKDAAWIATFYTNRFQLVLTNLPAAEYEYSFVLGTESSSAAASTNVSFVVTNFPFRLGPFSVTDLGTLGGTQTIAYAINNRGQVVGKSRNSNDQDRAVLFENGTIRDLGTLGGAASRALAINELGDVAGAAERANGVSVGFVYRTNVMTDLQLIGEGEASGINDRGDIVGTVTNGGFAILNGHGINLWFRPYAINNQREVVGDGGEPVIENLGNEPPFMDDPTENAYIARATEFGRGSAFAINEARQFTGIMEDGDYRSYRASAALYSEGYLRPLTAGLAKYGKGLGINRWGEVVGSYLPRWDGTVLGRPDPNPPTGLEKRDTEALLANALGTVNLNRLIPADSGWVLMEATDINDWGQIVGYGRKDGEVRAFRLDPELSMARIEKTGERVMGRVYTRLAETVRMEASSDLVDWQGVSTNTANGFEATFEDASGGSARFYRAGPMSE